MRARIKAMAYTLPEQVLDNHELARQFPEWTAERIEQKLGIGKRHIAGQSECASDLAFFAAEKLLVQNNQKRESVDYLLLCTQSPDYILPTTACILQHKLKLPTTCGALDYNLGCSGYVYGLGLAKGLIETGQARNVLLLTAETYSKHIEESDKNVRTLFGDGAAATWVERIEDATECIGPFVYGTDGSGAADLMIEAGGMRMPAGKGDPYLRMNGPAIVAFTLQTVPTAIQQILEKSGLSLDHVDRIVFHQANAFILEALRKKAGIPSEKFIYALRDFGNTVSSTIPIALVEAESAGNLKPGMRVLLVGFGVGFSWGACLIRW
ncbi:MAG: ketoacyl-ACP synthase III [Deltaproteobacteria bacterium]